MARPRHALTSFRLPSSREPRQRRPWRRHALASPAFAPAAAAPSAGAAAAPSAGVAAATSAVGSGSSARGGWIVTTTASALAMLGIVTPSGSGRSDRCFDSFISICERSSSMNSGRSFGRQEISTSAMRCDTTPPWLFTPGDAASPLKWIGMWMRIFSVSTTRCRSTCTMALRAGCICRSLTIAACFLSPTVEVDDRGIELLVVHQRHQLLVIESDGARLLVAAVEDCRHSSRVTKAAARTFALRIAELGGEFE